MLLLCDYFLPGYKAGGPIRSVTNILLKADERYRFFILTRDRDWGDVEPYGIGAAGTWQDQLGARCRYLSPGELRLRSLRRILRDRPGDVQYLNSLFSWHLSIKAVLLRALRLVPRRPVIVAPRGELAASAIGLGRVKKLIYLKLSRASGAYHGLVWHAASDQEAALIHRWFGADASVVVARDFSGATLAVNGSHEVLTDPRLFRIVFISRISKMKNLDIALEILSGIKAAVKFDVFGPIEDPSYWAHCKRLARSLPPNASFAYHGALAPNQVQAVFGRSDLFLLPSRGESFGHAILEALASGCPVLTSDRTPWRDLDTYHAGWALPLDDLGRFREVIEDQAAKSPEARGDQRRAALDYARSHIDSGIAGEFDKLFDVALGVHPAPGIP